MDIIPEVGRQSEYFQKLEYNDQNIYILYPSGLADLNHLDLNHWFKSRFKSNDFFIKISDLNQLFLFYWNYEQFKPDLVK